MPGPSLRSHKRARNDGCDNETCADAGAASDTVVCGSTELTPGEDEYALADGELMHSTSKSSAGKRSWLRFLSCLDRKQGYTYVSCDGSSSGWHACVVAVGDHLHLRARWADMQVSRLVAHYFRVTHLLAMTRELQGTRNVGAEASAYALGISSLLQVNAKCSRAVVQCDFLNALAFDCAAANCHHPLLLTIYAGVKADLARRGDGLRLVRVHHPGHQHDGSWCAAHPRLQRAAAHAMRCRFTMLNVCADALASLGENITAVVPVSELQQLASGGDVTR